MLVKKSIVEKWYQTDSWVYKNFAYLFQNPLWQKKIPSGFSVCPYFWLSAIASPLLRIFLVFPIQYLIRPILKKLGAPATALDTWLFNTLHRFGIGPDTYSNGTGFGLGILVTATIAGIVCLSGIAIHELVKTYPILTSTHFGMFAFWSLMSFCALVSGILSHKVFAKSECKTTAYLYVWSALFVIGMFVFIPTELFHAFAVVFTSIGDGLKLIGHGLWVAITFLAKWGWFGLMWAPIGEYVPWWAYLLGFSAVAWVVGKLFENMEFKEVAQYREETTEEFWDRNYRAWLNLFQRIVTSSKYYSKGRIFAGEGKTPDWCDGLFSGEYENEVCYYTRTTLYRKALEIMLGTQLGELKKMYPVIQNDIWEIFIESNRGVEARFQRIGEILDGLPLTTVNFSEYVFRDAIRLARNSDELKGTIDAQIAQCKADKERKVIKHEARKNSWAAVTCLRVTTTITNGVAVGIQATSSFVAQVGTFFGYLWILVKAKKQGACPYIRFSAPVDVCPTCKGKRNVGENGHGNGYVISKCPTCKGSGTTVPNINQKPT